LSQARHPLNYLVRKKAGIKPLNDGGSIIGVSNLPFEEEIIKLEVGKIILYTDGIIEHQRIDGKVYNEERLKVKFIELDDHSCETIFKNIY